MTIKEDSHFGIRKELSPEQTLESSPVARWHHELLEGIYGNKITLIIFLKIFYLVLYSNEKLSYLYQDPNYVTNIKPVYNLLTNLLHL